MFLPVCGYLPLQFVGFPFSVETITTASKSSPLFVVLSSWHHHVCIYRTLGGKHLQRSTTRLWDNQKNPSNQPTNLPSTMLRPKTVRVAATHLCFFLCFGSWLGKWLLFLCFPTDNSWDIPATLKRQPGSVTNVTNPNNPVKPEDFFTKNHGLIGNPSPSLRWFLDAINMMSSDQKWWRNISQETTFYEYIESFFTPQVSSSSFFLRAKPI